MPEAPTPTNSIPTDSIANALEQKLKRAIALKDYAISKNFDVPNDAIERLNKAVETLEANGQSTERSKVADNIDKAIRDLTALTYPATIDTIARSYENQPAFRLFFFTLLVIGSSVGILAIISSTALVSVVQSQRPQFYVLL